MRWKHDAAVAENYRDALAIIAAESAKLRNRLLTLPEVDRLVAVEDKETRETLTNEDHRTVILSLAQALPATRRLRSSILPPAAPPDGIEPAAEVPAGVLMAGDLLTVLEGRAEALVRDGAVLAVAPGVSESEARRRFVAWAGEPPERLPPRVAAVVENWRRMAVAALELRRLLRVDLSPSDLVETTGSDKSARLGAAVLGLVVERRRLRALLSVPLTASPMPVTVASALAYAEAEAAVWRSGLASLPPEQRHIASRFAAQLRTLATDLRSDLIKGLLREDDALNATVDQPEMVGRQAAELAKARSREAAKKERDAAEAEKVRRIDAENALRIRQAAHEAEQRKALAEAAEEARREGEARAARAALRRSMLVRMVVAGSGPALALLAGLSIPAGSNAVAWWRTPSVWLWAASASPGAGLGVLILAGMLVYAVWTAKKAMEFATTPLLAVGLFLLGLIVPVPLIRCANISMAPVGFLVTETHLSPGGPVAVGMADLSNRLIHYRYTGFWGWEAVIQIAGYEPPVGVIYVASGDMMAAWQRGRGG
ncbi:coiled-coil domain-containing protein [Belnapia rosea]|uniref:Uncharacterized protein n=1 Tax=Belnapia rosea TaxID=938405 RepID=A0A1G7BT09_9PROT|nr:hypothetical protein [Belnapia rosea]SDE30133.1 hypothetical protein SAMN04487779_102711 [Belnapia rosea]